MNMKPMNKAVFHAVGLGVAAAGKAIKAVGEAVEHFSSGLKM